MTKKESIEDWQRMYKSLTDPEEIARSKRLAERQKRKEEKIKDYGLV
jgi:uncharacterized protein YmfQ (DUF2313 family)